MLFYTERYLDTISNSPTPCSDTFNKHGLTKLLDCWLTRNTGRAKNLLWWSLLLAFTSSLLFPLNVCMCLTAIISNVKPMKSGLLSNPTPYCTLVTYLCSKNGVWTMCFRPPQEKKNKKNKHRNPLSSNSKEGNTCEKSAEFVSFWGICSYNRLSKEETFSLLCPKYRVWLDSYFCMMCDSNYITLLSAGRGQDSIWKKSLVQIPSANNACLVGSVQEASWR